MRTRAVIGVRMVCAPHRAQVASWSCIVLTSLVASVPATGGISSLTGGLVRVPPICSGGSNNGPSWWSRQAVWSDALWSSMLVPIRAAKEAAHYARYSKSL